MMEDWPSIPISARDWPYVPSSEMADGFLLGYTRGAFEAGGRNNNKIFPPRKIRKDGRVTVVFWKDGTTTAVRCGEGEKYDDYTAFCAAIAKRICGSNSAIKRMLKDTPVEIPEDWAMKSVAASIEDAFSKNKIRESMLGKKKK